MTFMQRSFTYILHNKRNNGIMLLLFLFITTFVLLGSHVIEFTGQIAEKLRENIGGVIYLYPNMANTDDMSGKKLFLTDEVVGEIRENEQIASFNLQKTGEVSSEYIEFIPGQNASENNNVGFAYSDTYSECNDYFIRERFILSEGRHITTEDEYAIIISNELAEYNDFSLGDTVSIAPAKLAMVNGAYVNLLQDTRDQVAATIVGIYIISEKQGGGELQPTAGRWENLLFTTHALLEQLDVALPEEYSSAAIFVKDPAMIDDTVKYVRNQCEFGKNECVIQKNTAGYDRVADNVLLVERIFRALLSGIVAVGIVVLLLFMKFHYKGRIKEFGILLSLGKSKAELSLQLFFELMVVFLPAFLLSAGVAAMISEAVIQELEKNVFEGITYMDTLVWKIYVAALVRIFIMELFLIIVSSFGLRLSILQICPQQILTRLE